MSDDPTAPVIGASSSPNPTLAGVLSDAVGRVRRDPVIALPFAAAGVVLAAVDWLRVHDPVPTRLSGGIQDGTVTVAFSVYPAGVPETSLPLAALVDLKPAYLLWAVGLELVALLAVGIAGWFTLSRAARVPARADRLLAYLGFVLAVRVAFHLLAPLDGLGPVVSVILLVGVAVAFVRLFVAPALVVGGDDVGTAVGRSASITRGHWGLVIGLVVLLGLGAWLLGSLPAVGTVLSFSVVAPVHAVAVVRLVEELDGEAGTG